ncbi:MAG: transglutaminase domain-containing protein [Akkermansiaceae bacterium]|nr:transglutaminase domain-containing protein [Akkermansiaceae bacterium]
MSTSPPRLLAGASLLFWGYLTEHLVAGVLAAVLLEARSWLGLRWDFKRESYIKAWQFSILCGAFIAILAWMNGMKVGKIHTLFVWAPLIILPVELAQRYGNAKTIPLNTFSFFARKKMEQDIEYGRNISPRMINTGYPYMAVVVLATAMASRNELYHFIGLALVLGTSLYSYMRKAGFRPWAWITAFLLVLTLSYLGQWGMFKLYNYYVDGEGGDSSRHTSANEATTSIGRLGRLKLSPRIFWRMKVVEGNTPTLLRTATYNQYFRARWSHEFRHMADSDYDEFGYRRYSEAVDATEDDRDIRWFTKDEPVLSEQAPITIIGEVDAKVEENPLPLPHFFLAIGDLDAEADIECNSLGTVRMANPNYNVVEYAIWLGDTSSTEDPPDPEPDQKKNLDLSIPHQEQNALQRVCHQLDLYNQNLSTRDKISKLRHFFNTEFKYSTHLNTPHIDRAKRQSAVGIFLETTRSGHCEYFATSTAMLLRETGVPARYCVGFSVNERDHDRDEWVMRGTHAHAWCRVWIEEANQQGKIEGHWEDVDLTPAAWESMDTAHIGQWQQKLSDWWQRFREDFLIWRTRETNKNKVYVVVAIIITLLVLWISWRLWQSRQRQTRSKQARYRRPKDSPVTPLHRLERLAAKKIGARPDGSPLCDWLQGLLQVDHPAKQALESSLIPAIRIHSIIRFDPKGASPEHHQELADLCIKLKDGIKQLPSRQN